MTIRHAGELSNYVHCRVRSTLLTVLKHGAVGVISTHNIMHASTLFSAHGESRNNKSHQLLHEQTLRAKRGRVLTSMSSLPRGVERIGK